MEDQNMKFDLISAPNSVGAPAPTSATCAATISTSAMGNTSVVELPRENYFTVTPMNNEASNAPPSPDTASQSPEQQPLEPADQPADFYLNGLESENEALRAELEALRLELEATGEEDFLVVTMHDASTQACLPWASHGGWLLPPRAEATHGRPASWHRARARRRACS